MNATRKETLRSLPKIAPNINRNISGNRKTKNIAVLSRKARLIPTLANTLTGKNAFLKVPILIPQLPSSQVDKDVFQISLLYMLFFLKAFFQKLPDEVFGCIEGDDLAVIHDG